MTFGSPQSFWLLIPAFLLIGIAITLQWQRQRRLRSFVKQHATWQVMYLGAPNGYRILRWILFTIATVLLVTALAQPRWGHEWREVKQRGLDLMVLLDTSNSMRAQDLKPDRLQRAKWGIEDLTRNLKGDRIGLVAFAGSAFLQCPLTLDYAAFLMHLDDMEPGIIPRGGTDIGVALRTAIRGFGEEEREADRAIILITDGEDHEENLAKTLEQLKKSNTRVYVVGVGTPDGELIPMPAADGSSTYLKNRDGDVVKTRLNEAALQEVSNKTGGLYVRATSADFGLKRIYEEGIQHLRKSEVGESRIKQHHEQYQWFLAAGLFLLLLEALTPLPAARYNAEARK